MRDIKFRVWNRVIKKLDYWQPICYDNLIGQKGMTESDLYVVMQYTGLKDKNGLTDIYEGDIIDKNGNVKGNIYENKKSETDLVIRGFGTKTWETTNKEAMERGCKYSE